MPLTDLKQAQSLTQYLTLAQLSKYFFKMALVVIPTYFLTRVIFGKTFGRGKKPVHSIWRSRGGIPR